MVGAMNTTHNTDTTTVTDPTATVDTWLAAYTEADRARREDLVATVWNESGELLDPPLGAAGRAAICDVTDALLAQFPGHTFRRTTALDAHHDVARYGWELSAPDGVVVLSGSDVVRFDPDGRLLTVTGFFGDLVSS